MEAKKIEAIKNYLSFYDAKYYDVQAELIDHFATAIEKYQRENPELTFKEAFKKADKDFGGRKGVWNYLTTVEQVVTRQAFLMLGQLMLKFLSWPQILLFVITFTFWHFTIPKIQSDLGLVFSLFAATGFILVWFINKKQLQHVKLYTPRQVNRVVIKLFGGMLGITYWYYKLINTTDQWVVVCCFGLLSMILIAMLRIPKAAINETLKKYPQLA